MKGLLGGVTTKFDSKIDRWFKPEEERLLEGTLVGYGWFHDSHKCAEVEYVVVVRTKLVGLDVTSEQVGVRIRPGLEELVLRADARGKCRIETEIQERGAVPLVRFQVTVEGERVIPLLLQHRGMFRRMTR